MALTRTTLTAPITASQLTFNVGNTTTGFPAVGTITASQPMLVDDEAMYIVAVPVAGTVTVRMRGADGTAAAAHDVLSAVVTSPNPGDFPAVQAGALTLRSPSDPDVITYGQDGVMTQPLEETIAYIAKNTAAAALTLSAPSLALNGLPFTITSQTAFAHVVTATGLLNTGAGALLSTITFPAQPGATVTLVSQNGLWNVTATSGTITFA